MSRTHKLPLGIERYLSALSKIYAQKRERELQQLLVNAQTRIEEEWTSDSWNGGTFGHALYLVLPQSLFLPIVEKKADLERRIEEDLNSLHNFTNEHIARVFLELEDVEESDWRQASGLLISGSRTVSAEAEGRIWADGQFRLFFSHKTEAKKETALLKSD